MARPGPRSIRKYSDEFKLTAVQLSHQPGMQVRTVAACCSNERWKLSCLRDTACNASFSSRNSGRISRITLPSSSFGGWTVPHSAHLGDHHSIWMSL
jgi:hypothetical protein